MGSTYANVTVVGAELEAVRALLAGSGALLAASGSDVIVFHPHDDGEGLGTGTTATQLSAALGVPVIDAVVFDDDFLQLLVLVDGAVAVRAVAPPTGAEILSEMAGDVGELPEDDIGSGLTSAEEAAALVAAIGRGDIAQLTAALDANNVFATQSHHGVFAALGLPTIASGWGYRYIVKDRDLFQGVALEEA